MSLKKGVTRKEIWLITYPIIFGNLAQTIIAITDTAFLGRLSDVSLGASMMAGIYYYIWATLPWGFAVGLQILVARRLGENKLERIGVIFQHGLRVVLLLGIVLLTSLYFVTPHILTAIISSPNVLAASLDYMDYRLYGIFFVSFNYLFRFFYIGLSFTKVITYTTLIMAGVNIVLDYLLIFGNWGFPEMGIKGAALASVTAEFSATMFFTFYTIRRLPIKKYAMDVYHKFEPWLVGHIFKLATPTMIQKLLSFSIWFIFFTFVEHMGETSIAVSGIIRSLYMLLGVPMFAFGATSSTLVSRLIGEGRSKDVIPTLARITLMSAFSVLPVLLLCFTIPGSLLSIYTDNPDLILASIDTLHVLCMAILIYVPAVILFEAVSGTGNTAHALIIELIVLAFYILGIYLLVNVFNVGVAGAWLTEIIYAGVMVVLSYFYMRYYNWQKKKL